MSALEKFFKVGNRVYVAGFGRTMDHATLRLYGSERDSRLSIVPEFVTIGTFFGGGWILRGIFPGIVTPGEAYCDLDIQTHKDRVTVYGQDGEPRSAIIRRPSVRDGIRCLVIKSCEDGDAFNQLTRHGRHSNPGYEYPRLHAVDISLRRSIAQDIERMAPLSVMEPDRRTAHR